jgi:methylated-DNA-protein-cysteine methyltransferase-like protein
VKNLPTEFTKKVKAIIKQIPFGKVATYGQIAQYAGNPRASRQIAWILHSCSEKDKLPWQRVVNSKGKISLPIGKGYNLQKRLLLSEGIEFDDRDIIFENYIWNRFKDQDYS